MLWHPLHQGKGIPYLSIYIYVYTPSYRIPTYPKGISSPETLVRASTSSTDINPDPNIPNRHGPRPNISNRRRPRANNPFLPPQISDPEPQSVSTDVITNQLSATDVEAPTVSVRSRAPPSLDAKSPPDFYQQTPRSHKLSPTAATTP